MPFRWRTTPGWWRRWKLVLADEAGDGLRGPVSVPSLLSDPNAPPAAPVCALWPDGGHPYYENMPRRQWPYPSDLADARRELLEPTPTA